MDLQNLYYQEVSGGEGAAELPVLVVVHGLFGSGDNWMTLAREWAKERRVFLVDLPNHGRSTWVEDGGLAASAVLLSRTLDAIASLCGGTDAVPTPVSVLGHSLGGKVAMRMALDIDAKVIATQQYRLHSLIAADVAPVAYKPSHTGYISALKSIDLSKVSARRDADAQLAAEVPEPALRGFLLKNLYRDERGRYGWKLNLDAIERDYPDLIGWNGSPGERSSVPVLFLRGTASGYIVPELHRDAIWGKFPRAVVEDIQGAGHWLHAEQPQRIIEIVGKFLAA